MEEPILNSSPGPGSVPGSSSVPAAPDAARLREADAYLRSHGTLACLRTRQSYSRFSPGQLAGILAAIRQTGGLDALRQAVESVARQKEKESFYTLPQDILVNNVPQPNASPFYAGEKRDVRVLTQDTYRLYSDNLKLTCARQELTRLEDSLWTAGRVLPANDARGGRKARAAGHAPDGPGRHAWTFTARPLKTDYLYNDLADRQYMKRYVEGPFAPVPFKGTVLVSDGDRIFCLDALTGETIWDLAPGTDGRPYYQTFRHLNQNAASRDFVIGDDTLFAELDGTLVAVDVRDVLKPRVLWERTLGEYASATLPVVCGERVVLGLRSDRGELWMCGFDARSGSLAWSAYIGMSSYLSPACRLYARAGDALLLGTNHGVLICLSPVDGRLHWIKEYEPRKYNMIDFWLQRQFKGRYFDRGFIDFDSQFLTALDGTIYFKARESDHLYILDMQGKTIDDIAADPGGCRLLAAPGGNLLFLETARAGSDARLSLVTRDDQTVFDLALPGGELSGISPLSEHEILFKIDGTVHYIDVRDPASHTAVPVGRPSPLFKESDIDLPSLKEELKDGADIHSLVLSTAGLDKNGIDGASGDALLRALNALLDRRDLAAQAHVDLNDLGLDPAPDRPGPSDADGLRRFNRSLLIGAYPSGLGMTAETQEWMVHADRALMFAGQGDRLKAVRWGDRAPEADPSLAAWRTARKAIADGLRTAVASGAPPDAGLIDRMDAASMPLDGMLPFIVENAAKLDAAGWEPFFKKLESLYPDRIVSVRGIEMRLDNLLGSLGFVKPAARACPAPPGPAAGDPLRLTAARGGLIPVRVLRGPASPDFFLMTNYDQVLCVGDDGAVRWTRNLFINSYFRKITVEAYLYDDVLILNNRIGVVAVDKNTGAYRWSATDTAVRNKAGYFAGTFAGKLSVGRCGDRLLVLGGDRLSAVDPRTGYPLATLARGGMRKLAADDAKVYVYDEAARKVLEFTPALEPVREILLGPVSGVLRDDDDVALIVLDGHLAFYRASTLYGIRTDTGACIGALPLPAPCEKTPYLERAGNGLLLIEPLRQAAKYSFGDALSLDWSYAVEPDKGKVRTLPSRSFVVDGECAAVALLEGTVCSVLLIDIASGACRWKRPVAGDVAEWFYLSEFVTAGPRIYFVVTAALGDRALLSAWTLSNLQARLYALDKGSGSRDMIDEYPCFGIAAEFEKPNHLVSTDRWIVASDELAVRSYPV